MDWWLISLRVAHVGAAMAWFGGAVLSGFFLEPTARALGQAGQPFMDHLVRRRRMGIFFPIVATLTVLAGGALYWRDSGGLQGSWITSPPGLAYTVGGLAALVAFVGGFVLIGPSVATQSAVQHELEHGNGTPTDSQRRRLERAEARLQLANRVDLPLLLLAGLMMAVGRYL